ncbi:MAG: hypothetical protein AAF645_30715, partial [Myxococcota bacterium]
CPPDALRAPGSVCRGADDAACRDEGVCTGDDASCPPSAFADQDTQCAPEGSSECDMEPDFCDPMTGTCRAQFTPAGVPCSAGPNFECDGAGNCIDPPNCGEPCTLPDQPCMLGAFACNDDGTELGCQPAGSRPVGESCTPSAGRQPCEVEEATCNNTGQCVRAIAVGSACDAAPDNECLAAPVCVAGNPLCPDPLPRAGTPSCGPSSACQDNVCIEGACVTRDLNEGEQCAAGSGPCVSESICESGACVPARPTDGNRCGDQRETDCDGPDSCQDGVCQDNVFPPETSCGGTLATECAGGACTTDGECEFTEAEDGTACGFDRGVCLSGLCGTLLISEVAFGRSLEVPPPDYIEVYNSSPAEMSIEGCTLEVEGAIVYAFPEGELAPFQFAAIRDEGGFVPGFDFNGTAELDLDRLRGSVALVCPTPSGVQTLDAVAWGGAAGGEGSPLGGPPPVIGIDDTGWDSFERKACQNSTAMSLAFGTEQTHGNAFDTNQNRFDFVRQSN